MGSNILTQEGFKFGTCKMSAIVRKKVYRKTKHGKQTTQCCLMVPTEVAVDIGTTSRNLE